MTQLQRAVCVFCLAVVESNIWKACACVPATAFAAYLHHICTCVSQLLDKKPTAGKGHHAGGHDIFNRAHDQCWGMERHALAR